MKLKDFLFAEYFINDCGIENSLAKQILEYPIEISQLGEQDNLVDRGNILIYHRPSTLVRFLFSTVYHAVSKHLVENTEKDRLSLALLQMCRDYVYGSSKNKNSGPPVLISFDKLSIPSFIVKEVVSPFVGNLPNVKVFFTHCNFTDSARIVKNADGLAKYYNIKVNPVKYSDYPIILANMNVENKSAQLAHILVKYLDLTLGEEKSSKIIKKLILGNEAETLPSVLSILKILHGDHEFVFNFLKYLESHADLNIDEKMVAHEIQYNSIISDNYLKNFVKTASDNTSSQVWQQWSQWSMLMGLIEKQLGPMRGSMWPTSEHMKKHDDRLKNLFMKKMLDENKSQLNFEQLLETTREMFQHKAIEPGLLTETLLRDNRIWK